MNRFKVCKLCITFIVIFAFVITIVCTVSVVCKKYEMNNKHTNSMNHQMVTQFDLSLIKI